MTRNCIRRIPKHSFRRATSPVRQVPSDLGFKHSFMRGTGPIRQVLSDIGFKHSFMRTTNTRRLCRAEKPAQGRERSLALLGRRTSLLSSRFRQTFDGGVRYAFPMVHLSIARNILGAAHHIKNPCQFMLGSIAPDSVHFRPDFNSDMKKVSHLVVGDERWGYVTDNAGWKENVLTFLDLMRDFEDTDFILGYCAHILADIKHNVEIWTPFRLEHQHELDSGQGSALHREAIEVDLELYRTCPRDPRYGFARARRLWTSPE